MCKDVCPPRPKYAKIIIIIQNICNVGSGMPMPLRQHPVLHGVSVTNTQRMGISNRNTMWVILVKSCEPSATVVELIKSVI